MTDELERGATISPCARFRFSLWRRWAPGPRVAWIMLNPSTADALLDDATIRKCIGFGRRWGMGELVVVNLWAYRATKPRALELAWRDFNAGRDELDPRGGTDNDRAIERAVKRAVIVVAAWGANANRIAEDRAGSVELLLASMGEHVPPLKCLGTNKDGSPRHPLTLAYATELESFK